MLGIGGYHISRIRTEMNDPQACAKSFEKHIPPHVFTDEDKQRVKDGCFAIATKLSNPNITDERRAELISLKKKHISEAVAQRRVMQLFV